MVDIAYALFYLVGFVIFTPIAWCAYQVIREFISDLRGL
jgi:hypothetical protein